MAKKPAPRTRAGRRPPEPPKWDPLRASPRERYDHYKAKHVKPNKPFHRDEPPPQMLGTSHETGAA
jgi:hypothetical protein